MTVLFPVLHLSNCANSQVLTPLLCINWLLETVLESFQWQLNSNGLTFLKNKAIQGYSRECIIFVKIQYLEMINSFKDF